MANRLRQETIKLQCDIFSKAEVVEELFGKNSIFTELVFKLGKEMMKQNLPNSTEIYGLLTLREFKLLLAMVEEELSPDEEYGVFAKEAKNEVLGRN